VTRRVEEGASNQLLVLVDGRGAYARHLQRLSTTTAKDIRHQEAGPA
jgi:hypothetical protein